MDGTILSQGTFRSLGANAAANTIANANQMIIQIPSNADFMWVYNYTSFAAAGTNTATFQGVANGSTGMRYYWQRGMPAGQALVEYKTNAANGLNSDLMLTGGFTLYDPSNPNITPQLSAPVAFTAISNATQPVVLTASTAGLSVGSIVRLSNSTQTDNMSPEFVVGAVTAGVSFTLLTATNPLANVPGAVGGAGFYRIVLQNELFYPRKRYVVNITQAVQPTVSTSVPHGMTAGQAVRLQIPASSGMVQLNSTAANGYRYASILFVVDDYNFVIDIDTSAMTAFSWPTVVQQPSGYPVMVPVGENTAVALSSLQVLVPQEFGVQIPNTQVGILADATVNTGYLGMILGIGGNGNSLGTPILGPAGSIANVAGEQFPDTIYWVAGKSSLGGL